MKAKRIELCNAFSYTMGMTHETQSRLSKRSAERRKRMVTHRACSHKDAERWDLDYWQSKTPEERLSALVAIRNDVDKVHKAKQHFPKSHDR